MKDAVGNEVQRCLRQWGSAGRAAEVLERCEPWLSVEHLIIHNVNSNYAQSFSSIMSEGKRILSQIPGVRDVFAGETVQDNSKYKFCWSVRFTHQAVLDGFGENQEFESFLKKKFNANVSDLIGIDYRESA